MNSLSGKTFGKYQLVELLGSGGMAQVYRAVQSPLDRDVAIKVLHPHLTEQDTFRGRFLREAKAVASLRHPHIVQIYDYDLADGMCFMAMEFLDGLSLEDRLKELLETNGEPTPLSLPEALQIVIDVAEALDFAHQQGVVHRDVKPANIMQTADGRTILTDFGIATILHQTRVTMDGETSGTPAYMSPEQALGERGDERSDIYSLGAVLYQLVTGQLPFEADTLYGLIMKHVNDPPPPATQVNPALPPEIEQIIYKAMAKAPQERYQRAGEFAADLQAVLEGRPVNLEPVAAAPHKEAESPAPPGRGQSKLWWIGLALALLVVLVVARVFSTQPAAPSQASPEEAVDSMAVKEVSEQPGGVDSMTAAGQFSETFDDNKHNWLITDGPISRQLIEGAYQITVEVPNRAVNGYPDDGRLYYDFVYEAEAILLEGDPESGYGLVFRRQDNDNYYVFAINGLGQWSIWRLDNKIWHEIRNLPDGETWTDSDIILPAGEINRLKVEAVGPHLHLSVNDQPLPGGDLEDETFAVGGIGFYVASSRTTTDALARVRFDNIVVNPLEGADVPSMTGE